MQKTSPNSDGLQERTAADVHATLCALVSTHATTRAAWADYAAVLLEPTAVAFFAARLRDLQATKFTDIGAIKQPSKTVQRNPAADDCENDASAGIVCKHCHGAVPQVSVRVASMDGVTVDVTVPQRGIVRELAQAVAQVRGGVARGCTINTSDDILCSLCRRATSTHA
jgi:hypothetical protein